jgi:hypothetical protein
MSEVDFSTFLTDIDSDLQLAEDRDLRSLFALSKSVKDSLVPVHATAFKESLKERIDHRSVERSRFALLMERQNVVWMAFAAAGSLLSITGVVLLVLRRLRSAGETDQPTAAAPI